MMNAGAYRESLNIAQRDIKPSGILIFESGVYKLGGCDFAKPLDKTQSISKIVGA